MLKLPRCPALTLVQTSVGGCNLSLWFCVCWDSKMTVGTATTTVASQFHPDDDQSLGSKCWAPVIYGLHNSPHDRTEFHCFLFFFFFYWSNIHHHRRDRGCALSDTVCLTLIQPPPAKSWCPLTKACPGCSITQPVMPAPSALQPLVSALVTALLQNGWVCA